ncbi:hypothetical protein ABPG75_010647 [Micractinium tetrahymenae]
MAADLAGLLARLACSGLAHLQPTLHSVRLCLSSYLASGSLQTLHASAQSGDLSVGSLRALPALRELTLSGPGPWLLPREASLPPNLSQLHLRSNGEETLPPQLAHLSSLREVRLEARYLGEEALAPLTGLTGLLPLHLDSAHGDDPSLPAGLGELRSLQGFTLLVQQGFRLPEEPLEGQAAGALCSALPRWTALTSLELTPLPGLMGPPHTGGVLQRLRSFAWRRGFDEDLAELPPAGPWLSNLQQLTAQPMLLARSLQQLGAARQLVELHIAGCGPEAAAGSAAVLRCAAGLPALRRMVLDAGSLPREAVAAVLELQRRRPALSIELGGEPATP